MFESYSAETCARKILFVPMGDERRVPCARTRELGPPSALAEYPLVLLLFLVIVTFPDFTPERIVVGFQIFAWAWAWAIY